MKAQRLVVGISAGLLWLNLGLSAQDKAELKAQQSGEAWLALVDTSKSHRNPSVLGGEKWMHKTRL